MRSDTVARTCNFQYGIEMEVLQEEKGESDIFEAPPATSDQRVLFLPQLETQFSSNHSCNILKTWNDLLVMVLFAVVLRLGNGKSC